ncbi:MAG: hypothetical protein ABI972_02335 [Acidobacteriota bacterium]
MSLLAAAAVLVACSRAPDFDETATTGRYELQFTAQGDFEFTIRNNRLELELFEGAGPSSVVCTYTQRVPAGATFRTRLIKGTGKPRLSETSVRFVKADGPYELWIEWTNDRDLYHSPRPNTPLPNQPIRRDSTVFDNRLTGTATLTSTVKSNTTLYLRGPALHATPPLPGAKLSLSQPLPSRTLARFKASASGCKSKVVEDPESENGFTAVVLITPPDRPRECTLTLEWKR